MDESMKWTAKDDSVFREYVALSDFTEKLCEAERMEIRSWLDADAMGKVRDFAAYMERQGIDPESLTEVIEKVEYDPLTLTVYDLLNAGEVLHLVPSVAFLDKGPFVEAAFGDGAEG